MRLILGRRAAVLLLLGAAFCAAAPGAAAQDMDDLFSSPDGTVEAGAAADNEEGATAEPPAQAEQPPPEPADAVDIDALTTSPTTVRGRFTGRGGIGLGFVEWPGSAAAGDASPADLRRYSIFYDSSASVTVDSRPTPYLRFHTSLSTSLNEDTLTYAAPEVDELFVDYTFAETLFFRAGRYAMTWGRGRLFDNPANLVERVDDGAAVRATVPLWRASSFTGVIYSNEEWMDADGGGEGNYRAFAYAGQLETTVRSVTAELSGRYKDGEHTALAGGLTFGIGEVTFSGEGVYHWQGDRFGTLDGTDGYAMALANFLYRSPGGGWTLAGEYQFDGADIADDDGGRHLVGGAVSMPAFGRGGWRPGIRWRHAPADTSGEVLTAIRGTLAPSVNLEVGLPVIYGTPGSYYRDALAASVAGGDDDDESDLIPVDNVVMVLFALSLSIQF